MQKFRVYFAIKCQVTTSWFRRKKNVTESEYVVVSAYNEAHAVKEAKKHIPLDALEMPFTVTQIHPASADEAEGYHGTKYQPISTAPEDAGES